MLWLDQTKQFGTAAMDQVHRSGIRLTGQAERVRVGCNR
jgi:hypothetical protein